MTLQLRQHIGASAVANVAVGERVTRGQCVADVPPGALGAPIQVAQWPVQALEYKSFLRFKIGKILDDLCGNQLQPLLIKTLLN
ncbi:carbon starvation induced protein CsiD, partial [Salmonella enterica subsp. enterica serovar Anatum]|nr:carbon starvation induced protein CsiD [Salmonella enterica subsp. enterica serovar Anatum]